MYRYFLLVTWAAASCLAQPSGPIRPAQRAAWVVTSTVGPPNLIGGVIAAGWNTARNSPVEYGPGWRGFGQRYGIRLAEGGASSVMEAGLGALWNEDPRYFRSGGGGFKGRAGYLVKSAFAVRNQDGAWQPAYARYAAISGSSFLANTWRPDSDASASDAVIRTGLGFASRIVSNAFSEFWPDIKHRLFGD